MSYRVAIVASNTITRRTNRAQIIVMYKIFIKNIVATDKISPNLTILD